MPVGSILYKLPAGLLHLSRAIGAYFSGDTKAAATLAKHGSMQAGYSIAQVGAIAGAVALFPPAAAPAVFGAVVVQAVNIIAQKQLRQDLARPVAVALPSRDE